MQSRWTVNWNSAPVPDRLAALHCAAVANRRSRGAGRRAPASRRGDNLEPILAAGNAHQRQPGTAASAELPPQPPQADRLGDWTGPTERAAGCVWSPGFCRRWICSPRPTYRTCASMTCYNCNSYSNFLFTCVNKVFFLKATNFSSCSLSCRLFCEETRIHLLITCTFGCNVALYPKLNHDFFSNYCSSGSESRGRTGYNSSPRAASLAPLTSSHNWGP